jgi:hypothetical protein
MHRARLFIVRDLRDLDHGTRARLLSGYSERHAGEFWSRRVVAHRTSPRGSQTTSGLDERGGSREAQERTAPRRSPASPGDLDKQPRATPSPTQPVDLSPDPIPTDSRPGEASGALWRLQYGAWRGIGSSAHAPCGPLPHPRIRLWGPPARPSTDPAGSDAHSTLDERRQRPAVVAAATPPEVHQVPRVELVADGLTRFAEEPVDRADPENRSRFTKGHPLNRPGAF